MKKLGLGFLLFVSLLLILAAVLPSSYRIERSIQIASPPERVYALVADLHQWHQWSPWYEMDPSGHQVVGPADTIGQRMTRNSEKLGAGSMTMTALTKNQSVAYDLIFQRPRSAFSTGGFQLEPLTGGGTLVRWYGEGALDYPLGRFIGLMIDRMLGSDLAKGLNKLKQVAEVPAESGKTLDTPKKAKPIKKM